MVSKFHPYTFDISLSSPFGKGREHYSFEQTWIPFTEGCLAVPNLIEIGPVVLEENIFKFHRCIFSIYIFPWPENVWPFIWRNLNPLTALYPRCFMLSLIEFAQWFWRILSVYFRYFVHYLPFGKSVSLYLKNLKIPLPEDVLC